MPTEAVINRDFKSLFDAQVRYEIPFFQRGYAWERRQWKRMLEDVQDHVLNELETTDQFKDLELFFGPVVVLEKSNAPHPNLKRYLIIDGQQRITTVYLMLALIKKALDNKSHLSQEAQERSAEINSLIVNKIESDDDYMKIKVFSSKGDRLPTYLQIFTENPKSKSLAADQQLYVADQNQIDQFVKFFSKHIWFRPLLIGQFTFQGSKVVRFVFTFDMQGTTDGDSLYRVLFEMRGATISLFDFFAPSRGSKPCKGLPSGSSLPVC